MLILAVDPGSNGTGWAVLNSESARVMNWGTIHGTGTWENKFRQIMVSYRKLYGVREDYIGQTYLEWPMFMHGYGGQTTASTGALVKLAALAGAMYAHSLERQGGVVLVEPSKWKGQLPKTVCHSRIRRILESIETYEPVIGRISTHAMDAIGIGLWALGRFR